jgi:hypothetical protein
MALLPFIAGSNAKPGLLCGYFIEINKELPVLKF